jgi:hypothetical protein
MVAESQNSGKKEAALGLQLCNTHISAAMNKPHVWSHVIIFLLLPYQLLARLGMYVR